MQGIIDEFPGRKDQIVKLYRLISYSTRTIHVWGPPRTGKTAIVKKILQAFNVKWKQLHMLQQKLECWRDRLIKVLESEEGVEYILVDLLNQQIDQNNYEQLLQLMQISYPTVGVVFISREMSGEVFSDASVHFPHYKVEQTLNILKKYCRPQDCPENVFKDFLEFAIRPKIKTMSNNLNDAVSAVNQLLPVFLENEQKGGRKKSFQIVSKFDKENQFNPGLCYQSTGISQGQKDTADIEYNPADYMSILQKYLLLAAYIASRNKSSVDKDLLGESQNRRSSRRMSNAREHDKQADRALEHKLQGPGTFSLERWLWIYQAICQEDEDAPFKEEEVLHHTIFSFIRTLISMGLIKQVQGDALSDQVYACCAKEDYIQVLAKSRDFKLQSYIRYV